MMNDSTLLTESMAEPSTLAKAIISIVGLALIVTILGGNGLVLLLLIRFRRLRTTTNYFILGMASADFTVGIVLIGTIIVRFNPQFLTSPVHCLVYWCSAIAPSITSCWALFFANFDRYLKLAFPLRYHMIMSPKVAMSIVVCIYVYTTLAIYVFPAITGINTLNNDFNLTCWYKLSRVLSPNYMQFLIYGNVMLPIISICFLYGMVVRLVVDKLRHENIKLRLRRELRSIKTLAILLGLCVFGWFPLCSVLLIEIYNPSYQAGFGLRTIVGYCMFLNSALNPIVYSLRSARFRQCARKLICRESLADEYYVMLRTIRRSDNTVYPQ
ncbi:histamine H2 receptor-like [Amphiura filiformis]|uniref:histamine H2 receptor-like n=1 Tax=Amphiura filiformis TaxID=82378 RepID=UPI003B21E7DF